MSPQANIITLLFIPLFTRIHPASAQPIPSDPAPEKTQASDCRLHLPDKLFRDINSSCASETLPNQSYPESYLFQLHRSRCCPVLAPWLYYAYSNIALGIMTSKAPPPAQVGQDEMPDVPNDSNSCVDDLHKALGERNISLQSSNETCNVVTCECGIRLHPLSCRDAFRVNKSGALVGGPDVKRLERDCLGEKKDPSLKGCTRCLNALHLLHGDRNECSEERRREIHILDCQLMGLTWLLNKNRAAYMHTVSAVWRVISLNTNGEASDPRVCTFTKPIADDVKEPSSSAISTLGLHHHLVRLCTLVINLLCISKLL